MIVCSKCGIEEPPSWHDESCKAPTKKSTITLHLDSTQVLAVINSFSTVVSELECRIERLEDLLNIKRDKV